MRRAARKDGPQAEIVAALRRCGCSVAVLNDADLPDLLVGCSGRTLLLEVKRPKGPRGGTSGARLRPGQQAFAASWRGAPVAVVRSVAEALDAVGLVGG